MGISVTSMQKQLFVKLKLPWQPGISPLKPSDLCEHDDNSYLILSYGYAHHREFGIDILLKFQKGVKKFLCLRR